MTYESGNNPAKGKRVCDVVEDVSVKTGQPKYYDENNLPRKGEYVMVDEGHCRICDHIGQKLEGLVNKNGGRMPSGAMRLYLN